MEAKKNQHSFHLSVYNIALIGIMNATLEISKVALAFLPNIELVSLFIIIISLFFGALSSIPYLIIGGFSMGFAYWVARIFFKAKNMIHT